MNLIDFLNTLFNNLLGFEFMPLNDVITSISNCEHWFQMFSPNIIIPLMFTLCIAYGFMYVIFVLPFRYLKRWLRVPNSKGKR